MVEEYKFITDIISLISNNWDVFKYVFLGLAIKYTGQGLFEIVKALILAWMGIGKIFGKK